MNLRPSVIEFNMRKRCLSEVQHQLGHQYVDEGQLSKTSQVRNEYEDCDQDEIYNGYNEDNQSIDHFAHCVDNSSISCFVTEDAGFNILHECDKLIDKKCCINTFPKDASTILGSGSVTKLEFAQRMSNIINTYQVSENCTSALLLLFKDINPESNLPIHETLKGNLRVDIKSYVCPNNSAIHIDACESECMIFTGDNINLTKCSNCFVNRYFDCTETSCKNKTYDECNHKNRRAKKTIMYRPILPILTELLSHQFFLDALNYVYCKPDVNSSKYDYMDILDGSNAKEALAEMKKDSNKEI